MRKARISVGLAMLLLLGLCGSAFAARGASSRGTQGYLGVDIRDVTDDQLGTLKLKDATGAEIISMDHDGPACKAGLQVHDVILQMNGVMVAGEEQFRRMLRETPAGRMVSFLVSRDGQQRTITAQLANREEVEKQAWEQRYIVPEPDSSSSAYIHAGNGFLKSTPATAGTGTGALKGTHSLLGTTMIVSSAYTGAKLEVMGPQLAQFFGAEGSAGLLVRSVEPNSPAAQAGLKAGDVVVKVNQIPVASGTEWAKTIHENRGKQVNIVVLRDKKEQTLTMIPDAKKRSSVEHGIDLEGFFGFGDDATSTRSMLAQLEPVFEQMNDAMDLSYQQARMQLRVAAEAMREQMATPVCQPKMQ